MNRITRSSLELSKALKGVATRKVLFASPPLSALVENTHTAMASDKSLNEARYDIIFAGGVFFPARN